MVIPNNTKIKTAMNEKRESPRSIRFDPVVLEAVKSLAEKENRSFSNMVETLLKEALSLRRKVFQKEKKSDHPAAQPDRASRQSRNRQA